MDNTKLMVVCRGGPKLTTVQVDDKIIEKIPQFRYLGILVNEKWDQEMEIKSRIEQERQAFLKYK